MATISKTSKGRRCLCGLVALFLVCAADGHGARLAGGPRKGMYWELAATLAQEHRELALQAVETAGSAENLKRLESKDTDFAFAQQDVVSEYFRDHPDTRVRVVGRIFFDYLHIFLRDPVHVETVGDLGRLRIWAGEEGSGTRLTAARFLDRLGLPISSLGDRVVTLTAIEGHSEEETPDALDHLPQWFRDGRLDAAMLVTTPGVRPACRVMETGQVSLLALDPKTLRRLTEEKEEATFRRQIAIGQIDAGTYDNQSNPIPTIAVPVLLLAREGEKAAVAASLRDAATETWKSLAEASSRDDESCSIPIDGPSAAPLAESHLTMLKGLPDPTPLWRQALPAAWIALGLLAVSGLGLWGWRQEWHRQVRSLWRQDRLPFMAVLLLAVSIVLVTVITYFAERGINENFSSIPEAFWSITVYLFSGLEDRTPYTPLGRAVATLGLILGPAFFAVMSGWLAKVFIKREKRMPQNLRNHYLLLNWTGRAVEVVRELHHPIIREREGISVIVVLTDDESLELQRFKEAGSGRDGAFEDFYVSIGDPTNERALLNANAADARTILILTHDQHGDERTLRSILMLRKIARDAGRTDLHVVAELSDPANYVALEELAKDFPGLLERISGRHLQTLLLSQAALSVGVAGFYADLLQVSADSNETYILELPPTAIGMAFRDYAAVVLRTGTDEPLIPVGVQRRVDGKVKIFTNPRAGEPGWILEPGDRLLVIAYLPPLPGALPAPQAAA